MNRWAVALCATLLLCAAPAIAMPCSTPGEARQIVAQVAAMMNAERQSRGLPPLQPSAAAQRAAEHQVCDMARNGVVSHRGSDGSTFARRISLAGGCAPGGENIAWGHRSPGSVMSGWMSSKGHRDNILHRRARTYGIAVAAPEPHVGGGPRWVMVVSGC
jgi:uncharacterized protein YkwD